MSAAKPIFFFDTNVLLYWVDGRNAARQQSARDWVLAAWENQQCRVSWQVLHEFYANASRKLGMPAREARTLVELFAKLAPGNVNTGLVRRAWHWSDSAGVSYWDGLILASAEAAGCAYLVSEDFQAGRKYGEVTVLNPFREDAGKFGLRGKP